MLSKFPEMLNFYFEFIYLIKPKLSKSDEIIHNNISGNDKSTKEGRPHFGNCRTAFCDYFFMNNISKLRFRNECRKLFKRSKTTFKSSING